MDANSLANELEILLDEIYSDPSLMMLLKDIWEKDSKLAKIFFAHKDQLFPSLAEEEFDIKLKYLFWNNYISSVSFEPSVMAIEYEATKAVRKHWGKQIDITFIELLHDIRDVTIYYIIRLIKASPELTSLIDSSDFSFNEMRQVLKDYSCLEKELEKLFLDFTNIDSIEDEVIRTKLNRVAKLKWFNKSLEVIADASRTSNLFNMLPLWGQEIKENLISSQDLQPEEYTGAINQAYMLGLFDWCQSLFWCENCRDTRQVYFTSSKLDPYHVKMSCLKCGEPMYAAIAYRLKPILMRMIIFRDGMLGIALGYYFNSENIKYEYSFKGEYENDFICDIKGKNVLVECKMHMTDVLDRGVRNVLQKDLKQLIKHAKALKESGIKIVRIISISNYRKKNMEKTASQILSSKKYAEDVKEYNAELISYEEVPILIQSLR